MFHTARQGAVDVVSGTVPLNEEHAALARTAFDQCFGKGQPRIVVSFVGVPLIDSVGLELLLEIRDRCLQSGGAVQLAAPSALCRDILQATGVANEFAVFSDVNSAVGSFAQ